MDPSPVSGVQWLEIDNAMASLWMFAGLVLFFVTNAIIGLIFIPTLVSSYHIPHKANKVRPVFYLLAALSMAGAVGMFLRTAYFAGVIEQIYPNYWI